MKNKLTPIECTALLLLFATPAVCSASTLTWTGNAALFNRWSEPGNWSPSGPPANGDTLVFPAGFTPVNDLNNLTVHSIQFTGNGSTYLSGNPVTVQSDITAASNNGEARVSFDITFSSGGGTFYTLGSSFLNIEDNVILGNNLALNLYALTTNILVQGSIQGAADLVKLGLGDAYLQGTLANTYTGGTYVRGGNLHLAKSANVVAIPPKLSVGENTTVSGSIVDDAAGQYPATMDVTVGPYGLWMLNNQATVTNLSLINGGPLGWLAPGGSIHGFGILTLDCDVNVFGTNNCNVSCALYMGGQTRTFYVDDGNWTHGFVKVNSVVGTGLAGITKSGAGALVLSGPNDYAGPTLVQQGLLEVAANTALGASSGANAGTTIGDGATIRFDSVTLSESLAFGNDTAIQYFRTNTLNGPMTLNGYCALSGNSHGTGGSADLLQLNGVISGSGPINIGGGYVRLGGSAPNTFTGGVVVGEDHFGIGFPVTLELAKPNNVTAVPGQVDVNDFYPPSGTASILRNLQDNGVSDVRVGHAAQWLLNGHVAAPRSLTFYGDGLVDSQGGQLQMTNAPGTNRFYAVASLSNPNYTARIFGTVALLSPTDEFSVDSGPTLEIDALITGSGNLSKTGPGALTITGTDFNNYAGETFVNQGTLLLNKPYAATAIPGPVEVGAVDGSSAGTLRNLNSYQIVGGIIVHSLGLYDVNGQVENTDYLGMDGNAVVQTGAGYLSLKTGAGITVNPGVNTTATINDHMFMDAGVHIFTVGSGSSLQGVQDLVINAVIDETSPTASIQKEGPGQLRLSGNSSYTGATYVNHGKLFPTGPGALGATNGFTFVANDATLALDGGVSIPDEALYLNSIAPAALESQSGSNTWAGEINITGDSRIGVANGLNAYGIIDGSGNLIKVGPGTLTLDGGAYSANSYSGDTFVNQGTLAMKKAQLGTLSVPHNVTVGTGPGGPPATLVNMNEGSIGGRVTVNDDGIWNLNQWFVDFTTEAILGGPALTLNGSASVQTGGIIFSDGGSIVVNAGNNTTASVYSGLNLFTANPLHITVSSGGNQAGKPECVINGPIAQFVSPSSVIKDGAGTLRLTATNTYTGTNFVTAGTMWIDGVQPQSPVLVTGGTLGGYGTAGNIIMNGGGAVISPGESPGILTCSNFNAGSGTFRAELNGTTPGSGYDQLNALGTVSLNGISLDASLNFASAVNDQFTIINNDGSDAVTGTFNGLPQGKKLYIGQELFQISYTGGSGNDVVLSRLVTPPPPVLTIARAATNAVRLTWATNDPAFSLQTGTNLSSANWSAALPLPVVIGSNNVVTNITTNAAQFYRLKNP